MKIIDLFAGAGGMALGFKNAGFEIRFAVEKDEWASKTYSFNHNETVVINDDIKMVDIDNYPLLFKEKIDGVVGGPPCQGFSLSGRRDIKDPRNSLFVEFVRIVSITNPKFFVMENVKGILSMKTADMESVSDIICTEFRELGYEVKFDILNSADYGVPQKRERVFFIGIRNDYVEKINVDDLFPEKESTNYISIEDAISDLPHIESGESGNDKSYKKDPSNDYQILMRCKGEGVQNHEAMRHTSRLIERFSIIRQGQSLADVPKEHMQRKRGESDKISGKKYSQNNMRPFYNKPAPTIPASFQSNFVHPKINRNFTAREGARLQSFPDCFVFQGKRTTMSWEKNLSQYQQIGNAVPPLLAEAIAKKIQKLFNDAE